MVMAQRRTEQTTGAGFDAWFNRVLNPDSIDADLTASPSSLEPHYSVQVLAELWRLDESTIRRIFESAPGVLRLGNERRRSGKREYFTLRIPASVAEREYQRRIVAATQKKGA